MKFFYFTGYGNYSTVFGWDSGISVGIVKEISPEEFWDMYKDYSVAVQEPVPFPSEARKGVHVAFYNEYGGSRDIRGYIVADSKEEAEKLLEEWEKEFNDDYYRPYEGD